MTMTTIVNQCQSCGYQTLSSAQYGISHFKPGTNLICSNMTLFLTKNVTHQCKDCGFYGEKPTVWVTWHTRPDGSGMCDATKGLHWEELPPNVEFDTEKPVIEIEPKKIKFREFL